jgi:hypothetical protein
LSAASASGEAGPRSKKAQFPETRGPVLAVSSVWTVGSSFLELVPLVTSCVAWADFPQKFNSHDGWPVPRPSHTCSNPVPPRTARWPFCSVQLLLIILL